MSINDDYVDKLGDRARLLEAREEIMHRHLDAIGAPTHSNGSALNINGRMEDYLRRNADLVLKAYKHNYFKDN